MIQTDNILLLPPKAPIRHESRLFNCSGNREYKTDVTSYCKCPEIKCHRKIIVKIPHFNSTIFRFTLRVQGIKEDGNSLWNQTENEGSVINFESHSACYKDTGILDYRNAFQYSLFKCSSRRRLMNGCG